VDVGSVDLEDVVVEVRAGFEVRVRMTVDGEPAPSSIPPAPVPRGAPPDTPLPPPLTPPAPTPPRPTLQLRLQSREPFNILESAANSNMTFDPAGIYTFPGVPEGRYRFVVNPIPPNAYVEDIREGSVSIFDEGLSLSGITAGEITVLINTKGASVKGIVSGSEQEPIEGALVALVPALARRSNIALYKTARSDDKGEYTINGVAPGEYRMFAWESVPTGAWLNADFMVLHEARGKSVTMTAGGSAGADLKVIPREIR
jgi:hypothetical protein